VVLLLATHNAVVVRTPLAGFLHQTNDPGTLAATRPNFGASG
jgi:hypothetical protein